MKVYCDNQIKIHLTKHPVFHERSKHIDIKMHFVRDVVQKGLVQVVKVPIQDMLTKVVLKSKFMHCMDLVKCNGVH